MKGEKSYIVIYSFMIEDLKLTGNELILFAYIYGFCSKYGVCDSSLSFLEKKVGLQRKSLIRVLKNLIDGEFIIKLNEKGNRGLNHYTINESKCATSVKMTPEPVSKMDNSSVKMTPDTSVKMTPQENNIENSINKDIKENIIKESLVDDDSNEPSWEEIVNELRM